MNCTEVRAALPLLIYDEPSPQDAALREHLAHCADCRREHEALQGVRRLLDEAPVPRIEVDLPRLYQSLTDRQARRLRRWRRVALAFGSVAAVLLLAIGLRVQVRLQSGQMLVSWGDPPPAPPVGQAFQSDTAVVESQAEKPDQREDLRVLSDLIHALKQDADERDQRFGERLDRLQKHVVALQSQADLRWNATENDVAALYLLTRKGE
ncbi:MAG: anti-sigma factor family protein [Gemmataceae bacterium]